ncbi:MAG TPA: polysaccharide deacetylase family protein [Pirellulaceae bacterium]|nr:polysaccharide deacetylase family protein [Pirellulaceae bacterium]
MLNSRARSLLLTALCGVWLVLGSTSRVLAEEQVRVARWKDDKAAAFLLMFDDSWPSHWQVVAPELVKRKMTATFYICPGKGEYQKFAKEWEETLWRQGLVYGDHTMTHKGVTDLANAEWEIGECAQYIRKTTQSKADRLVSYGQPGVGPKDWNITGEQLDELLKKHRLISRPTFVDHGAVYHLKTAKEMLALADKAIAGHGMEYVVFHGVERITPDWGYQDMWPLQQEIFLAVLDGLQERRDKGQLWITDHISMHQYETERDRAKVRVVESNGSRLRLELTSKADPRYYDAPLTLVARLPADWKMARVTQGEKQTMVASESGVIRFDALPGDQPITLERVEEQ